jgi:hypothetical protein
MDMSAMATACACGGVAGALHALSNSTPMSNTGTSQRRPPKTPFMHHLNLCVA